MSTEKKPRGRGRPFQKGDPRIGRNALPPEVREAKRISFIEFNILGNELISMSLEELKAVTKNPNERVDKQMIASAILHGLNGNQNALNSLWDRLYGKPAETINHSGVNMELDMSKLPLDNLKKIREMLNGK